jgi:hypothetical protein
MAYPNKNPDFSEMMHLLEMLKIYHDIGIYEEVVRDAEEATEDDRYEFSELGIECVAPMFRFEEVPMGGDEEPLSEDEALSGYCDHCHSIYRFASPEMKEYHRLCRLYELRESISPEQNPFVKDAHDFCRMCANRVEGWLWMGFDGDAHASELAAEICQDEFYDSLGLIMAVHETLEYHKVRLDDIRLEILKGPPVCFPALPAPKGGARE